MKRSGFKTGARERGGTFQRACMAEGCDELFWTFASTGRKFCSPACMYRSKGPSSEAHKQKIRAKMLDRSEEKNPNYRHGRRVGQQDRELGRLFNLSLKGEDRCRLCLSRDNVQLHHAIPRSVGTRESRLDLRNGIPLCASHHVTWHRGGRCVPREAFTEEEWEYLLSVDLTGREVVAWLEDHYPQRHDGEA